MDRETIHRHRSERLIDRLLACTTEQPKYRAKPQPKDPAKEAQKLVKYENLDTQQILTKILGHVNSKKQLKSLQLLRKLLQEKSDLIRPTVLFNSFVILMQADTQGYEESKVIEQIYFLLLDVADQGDFTSDQVEVLDAYYIQAVLQAQFFSDDSFKFTQVTNTLLEILVNEVVFSQNEQVAFGIDQIGDDHLFCVDSLKQSLVFKAVVKCYELNKRKEWAKASLQGLLRRAYQLKDKFSEAQQDALADLLNDLKLNHQKLTQIRAVEVSRDSKIKVNLLDTQGVQVSDGRQQKVVMTNAADKWANKQLD